jgi:hypothetical protein
MDVAYWTVEMECTTTQNGTPGIAFGACPIKSASSTLVFRYQKTMLYFMELRYCLPIGYRNFLPRLDHPQKVITL